MQNNIELPGRDKDVLNKINNAAAFILSSDYEGMPNALIEAMCMGMPVISTDCPSGGPRELIKDDENGLLVPVSDEKKLTQALRKITDTEFSDKIGRDAFSIREVLKPYVFTSDDITTSFLDQRYDLLKDKFIFFNGGSTGKITHYMGKDTILQLAERHGIPVLKNIVVERGVIPEGLEYPIITKAAISTIGDWKKDVFICNSQEELEEAFKHIRSSRVMLQKYIHKKNELALEAVSANKGTNMCIAIASTYNYILPDTYSPYMTVTNFRDEELKSKLKAMIREIGFEKNLKKRNLS